MKNSNRESMAFSWARVSQLRCQAPEGETGREDSHPVESTTSVFLNDCEVIVHSTGLQKSFPTIGAYKHHVPNKSTWSGINDVFLLILETVHE